MTSEIAVMNRQAIALAADSAVTFAEGTGQKIFPSANKIFTLSKYQPVGVMIYGNADFMGIPWETIIKIYRSRLGQDTFKTVSGYAENFLDFLRQNDLLFSDSLKEQWEYVNRSIFWRFRLIEEKISKLVREVLHERGEIEEAVLQELTTKVIQQESDEWKKADTAISAPASLADQFSDMYEEVIDEAKSAIFEGLPLTNETSAQLTEIAVNLFLKFPSGKYIPESSGVVFAGFGTDDVFPVLESYTVEGRIAEYLKYRKDQKNCVSIGGSERAAVLPFAQREMVDTFMAGVDPEYQLRIGKFVDNLGDLFRGIQLDMIYDPEDDFGDPFYGEMEEQRELLSEIGKQLDQFLPSLSKYSHARHVNPVISVVQGLPKDELAAMAESLINLTSFKRRVSMQAETVGGPIDVAVISKGDGFIWIKRKRYFDGEMNPQFFANYYR